MTKLLWRDFWALYCPELNQVDLDACDWLQRLPAQWPSAGASPIDVCDWLGQIYSESVSEFHRKRAGQFFTPPTIARFMAGLCGPLANDARVVEPGAGVGILIAALAERQLETRSCSQWHVTAYETDAALRPALALALGYLRQWLEEQGVNFRFEIRPDDFILGNADILRPAPLLDLNVGRPSPQVVIANPPYFKLPKSDPRVSVLAEVVHGQPNIYALFMAAAATLLEDGGQLIFITPRSFCSGPYFRQFRKWFFGTMAVERLHLFGSRTDAFQRDEVLQENIILQASKTAVWPDTVSISSSHGTQDLGQVEPHATPLSEVLDLESTDAVLSIPTDPADDALQKAFGQWADRLKTHGLNISTGPIVPFRTQALAQGIDGAATAPVIWVQHVGRMAVSWPLLNFDKPQHIRIGSESHGLLLPNSNYILVRRFSPKEENSRITAAPYRKGELPTDFLGIENHVNYIHRPGGSLSENEALGLAAFLNSRWVDQYFRLSSGNTQVSATELRSLPLPPLGQIQQIGAKLKAADGISKVALVNRIVGEELDLPSESPNGKGGHMSKIEEAKDLLAALGLPPAQRNELAALTLLALANLAESDLWKAAQRRSIRIHEMIAFVEKNYHKRYAENTRETFRRQVLHQFEQARVVDRNPDDPTLPTNSPHAHYALSKVALPVVQGYGTKTGQRRLEKFKAEQGTLLELYQRSRHEHLIPLKDSAGHQYRLSPGKHNKLQVAVIEQFAPRFARGAKLLYLGDTANKTLAMDVEGLTRVGFPADKHSKLPDIVLYLPKKNWLYLIEAVTSHGPVSPKRYNELEAMLSRSKAGRVYVTAFPDFGEYIRHARNTAWETEVWMADTPDHLLHYNGDKFLGPRHPPKRRLKKK